MKEDRVAMIVFGAVAVGLLVIAWVIGIGMGAEHAEKEVRQQAVDAGVAEWRADQVTGVVTFEWKKAEVK